MTHADVNEAQSVRPSGRMSLLRLSVLGFTLIAFSAIGGAGCDCGTDPVDGGSPDPDPCTAGTDGCECDADGECGTDLACADDVCGECVWGTSGCPCAEGACTDGTDVCDQTDDVCRPTTACEEAGCEQFQLCDDSGQDAVCLEECEPGYDWNGINCTATPSCTEGDPGFFDCGTDRECEVSGGAVVCGDCINGTVDVNGECLDNDCGAVCGEGRTCSDNADGGAPVCGDCDPSYVEDPNGDCIDRVTCADLAEDAPCDSDEVCLEANATTDARCAAQANCDEGFVASPVSNACSQCVNCYDFSSGSAVPFPGVTGVGNNGFSSQETCVCELEEGYFQSQDDGRVKECDADNDGWANADLEEILDTDNAFSREQRCTVRRVSGFELRSDDYAEFQFGGEPTLARSRLVTVGEIVTKFGLPTTGVRTDPNGVEFIELFEREELDIESDFASRYENGLDLERLYEYGVQRAIDPGVDAGPGGADGGPVGGSDGGTTGGSDAGVPPGTIVAAPGRLLAAEANSLTKMCNHSRDDLNRDGVADVDQGHGNVPSDAAIASGPGIPDAISVYYRMAYFIELNRGFYVDNGCGDATTCHGTYVIQEKSRLDLGSETGLAFDYTPNESGYWQMCARSRDSDYPAATDPDSALDNNFDFAAWHAACDADVGACTTTNGRVHYDGRPLDTVGDIDNPAPDLDNGAARFPGMNHHSQFKCVTFQNSHAVPTTAPAIANRRPPVNEGYVLQDCAINPHTARPVPGELATNPLDPSLNCNPVDEADAATQRALNIEQNFFLAMKQNRYTNVDGNETVYSGGCISEGQEWERFCIVASELQSEANFGELFCGCGPNRTGVACEIGCPDDNLFSNREAQDGELVGYWMCARPTASEVETLTGTDGTTTYTLRGEVPAVVTPTEPLCEESDGGPNCSVGYSVHPYTIR